MITTFHLGQKLPHNVPDLFLKRVLPSLSAAVGSQTITYPYLPFREVNTGSPVVDRFLCQVGRLDGIYLVISDGRGIYLRC